MARFVFTAARRRALKKAQRASRGRHRSRAQRAAALRNLRKARAARRHHSRVRRHRRHHARRNPGMLCGNPFRKGHVRRTTRRKGTVFKRKGRTYIVTRLRNGIKVARPYSRHR